MKKLFAVMRSRGPAWDATRSIETQKDWPAHAAFMEGLEAEGFILLAGPLEGSPDVLLVAHAQNDAEVRSRLAEDPWGDDMLPVVQVRRWTLRLGSLPS